MSLFGKKPQLPSLASLGYSPPKEEATKFIKLLSSPNWRDWEKACGALAMMRVDSVIPAIASLVEREQGRGIVNVCEFTVKAIFTIGGPSAIRWLKKISTSSKVIQLHDERSGPVREWAREAATGLQLLQSKADITPRVKEFILALRKDSYKPGWDSEIFSSMTIPELWAIVAAKPGLLPWCMEEVANRIEGRIESNEPISEQEKTYTKEFGRLGSKMQIFFRVTDRYISYYTHYGRYKDALSRINSIVVHNLGGWDID